MYVPPTTIGVPTCWIWTSAKNNMGYGVFRYQGSTVYAHRLAYHFRYPEFPVKRQKEAITDLDHLCQNKLCVNPLHLEPVSHRENTTRGYQNKQTSSKYTGVDWLKKSNKWQARIYIDDKLKHLGTFLTEEEAADAYQKALETLN